MLNVIEGTLDLKIDNKTNCDFGSSKYVLITQIDAKLGRTIFLEFFIV